MFLKTHPSLWAHSNARKELFHLAVPEVERIVYSTCSINQIENEDIIKYVLHIAESYGFQLAKSFPKWECSGLPPSL